MWRESGAQKFKD
jgi:hypothetical protein